MLDRLTRAYRRHVHRRRVLVAIDTAIAAAPPELLEKYPSARMGVESLRRVREQIARGER